MALNKKRTTTTVQQSRPAAVTTTPAKAQPNKTIQQSLSKPAVQAKAQVPTSVQQSLSKPATTTPAKAQPNTAVVQQKISTPSVTPTYTAPSTPSYTAPSTPSYTAPSTPSYTAPSTSSTPAVSNTQGQTPLDLTKSAMEQTTGTVPTNAVQTLYDTISDSRQNVTPTSLNNIFDVLPNESPTQRTERWLNASNLVSGAANNNAARNVVRNNANSNSVRNDLNQMMHEYLTDTDVNPNAPFIEVPNMFPRIGPEMTRTVRRDSLAGSGNNISSNSLLDNVANSIAERLYGDGNAALSNETRQRYEEELARYDRQNLPDNLKYNIAVQNILDDLYGATTPDYNLDVNTADYEGGSGSGGGSRSGGGSGGSGGSGGADGLGGYDLNSLYDLINQQLAEYDNGYNTLMQNLLNAYNANYGSLNDSYLAALQALGLNYNDTEALLNSRFANSQQALEDQRKRAMQEAYIARMMDQKNIEDYLGASGFSGGATESILSSLLNNYRSNRNKIEENTQNSLRDLLQNYLDNLSTARQNYNSGLLSAENNRLSAAQNLANNLYESQANAASRYADQRANVYQGLYNTLANLALKG